MNISASFSGRKGGIDTRPAESSSRVGSYVGELEMHYTYMLRAINPIDERVEYIGVRSCKGHFADDLKYMSSSDHVHAAIADGVMFEKIVLADWPTREDAVAHEILLHERFNVARNPKFFNRARQTSTGFAGGSPHTEESKSKISAASRLMHAKPEAKAKHRAATKAALGTAEVRAKISEKTKEAFSRPEVQSLLKSEDRRNRLSAAMKTALAAPGVLERRTTLLKEALQDPEVVARRNAVHASQEYRGKLSAAQFDRYKDQSARDKTSVAMKDSCNKPGRREAMSIRALDVFSRPEVKAKLSAACIERYKDPAEREKTSKDASNLWALRKKYVEVTGYTGSLHKITKGMIRSMAPV